MLIGAHLSVADGYQRTVDYALQVGAECVQIFAKSPRQWEGKPIDPEKARQFVSLRREAGIGALFTHTAYLINLSTDDDSLRTRSIVALADEIDRGRLLGATGVVTHVGNDPTGEPRGAACRAASSITSALALCHQPAGETRLLLENTAGAGRSYGSTFEQMGWVLGDLGESDRAVVGVCLDTCHAHAFGMDVQSPAGWTGVLDEIESTCGSDSLGVIHANDCKYDRGMRKDRHEWIGDGFLGYRAFSAMLCETRLDSVPVITEMPGEVPKKDEENISRLKRLRGECA